MSDSEQTHAFFYQLDFDKALHFVHNNKVPVFHVTKLTVGGADIEGEPLTVIDPSTGDEIDVLAVGSYVGCNGFPTNPIDMGLIFSPNMARDFQNKTAGATDSKVEIECTLFEYERTAKSPEGKYFTRFKNNGDPITGKFAINSRLGGQKFAFSLPDYEASTPYMEVQCAIQSESGAKPAYRVHIEYGDGAKTLVPAEVAAVA